MTRYQARRDLPTHIVAAPGDRKSLCGIKKPMPVVWLPFASKHRYEHARCVECYMMAGLAAMLPPQQGALL